MRWSVRVKGVNEKCEWWDESLRERVASSVEREPRWLKLFYFNTFSFIRESTMV